MKGPIAEPVFFGRKERPVFGWIHSPAGEAAARVGVVICSPFGYEEACAHRSLRHFAEAAAQSGLPAIRFDYDGTGDSAGSESDPGHFDAWVSSIGEAATALGSRTGVRRFVLLGVRLGATLAALAATGRGDIEGLVAIAPIISGRSFLRELTALQRSHLGDSNHSSAGEHLREALGVTITPETWDSIGRVDLRELPSAPAPAVLVLDRLTLGKAAPWVQRIRELGADVEDHRVAGYEEMVLDPHDAQVPNDMLCITLAWLERVVSNGRAASANAESIQPATESKLSPAATADFSPDAGQRARVVERALWVDAEQRIFGILSQCPDMPAVPNRKCILLLNNGAAHHVGPSRLHVTLARRWAASGHVVLRIDLPGIGDSRPYDGEPENVVYSAKAVTGVSSAVHWLRKHFPDVECHGMGICSGGYHALKAVVAGAPLDGIVVVNPLTFFWKPGMSLDYEPFQLEIDASRYKRSMVSLHSWRKLLRGGVRIIPFVQVMFRRTSGVLILQARNIGRELGLPIEDDLGKELTDLARRDVRMSFIFADTDPGFGLLRLNAGWALGRLLHRNQLQIRVIGNANHSFTRQASREELTELLSSCVDKPLRSIGMRGQ